MQTNKHQIKLIGRREFVDFPLLSIFGIEAKIDTGAYTSSLHCENITLNNNTVKPTLYFTIKQDVVRTFMFEEFTQKKIKNSFGEMEERFVIKTIVRIGKKKIWSAISLSKRDNMRYPVLLGRKLLKGKFLVDVNQIHTEGIHLSTAFNQLTNTK
jgi:hypothetical protein